MNKMKMETENKAQKNIDIICSLFPNCAGETVDEQGRVKRTVNFSLLKQMLSDQETEGAEVYEFTWAGKKKAVAEANRPTRKTLRPCPEESVNWDETENLYIEGDNLEVLKLLQESYLGGVKFIYIDPPYNTGNDFVYRDNFHISAREYEETAGLFRNTDSNGRFHSEWCSMIYPRLLLARNLLREDGVIFISIDDHELDNLKKICDEIFGAGNFVANMIWQSTAGSNTGTDIITVTENILIYTKKRSVFRFDGMLADEKSYALSDEYEAERGRYALDKLDRRRVAGHYSEALNYGIEMPDGTVRYPGGGAEKSAEGWNYLWSRAKVQWGIENGFIEFKKTNGRWNVYNKRYAKVDNEGNPIERTVPFRNLILSDQCNTAQGTAELRELFGFRPFDFPKPSGLIRHLLLTAVRRDTEAVVLDFFSGSASAAQAVMQLNAEDGGRRRFIMVQLPELCGENTEAYKAGYTTICEIGKERIRRAGRRIQEEHPETARSLDAGFRVFKLDESNMKDVYYAPEELSQQRLAELASNIKEDRTELDLFFGCLLDWGLPLSMPYRAEKIDGYTVHIYNGGELVGCFAENLSEEAVRKIAGLRPRRAVFRDSCFAGSPAKINVLEIFRAYMPEDAEEIARRVKVI